VFRHSLVIFLVLITGLQSSTIGYAASVGPQDAVASATPLPCPVHAAMLHLNRGDCCSHHSTHSVPASCIAHCAGVAALPPSSLAISLIAARITLDPLVVVSFPSERPGPALRPPIA
jgi:hypothetical protein